MSELLRKEIVKIDKKLAKLHQQRKELLDSCLHENLVLVEEYTPGGYLNTDYTTSYYECSLCKKRSGEKITNHGNYG